MNRYLTTLHRAASGVLLAGVVLLLTACSTTTRNNIPELFSSPHFINPPANGAIQQAPATAAQFNCRAQGSKLNLDEVVPIDLSLFESDIREAILELSTLSGISIVVDDSVDGLISVNLSGQSLLASLRTLIAPGNFSYRVMEDFIFVGSASPDSRSFHQLSESCSYRPDYIKPSQLVELLQPFYRRFVTASDSHGSLTIVAPQQIQTRLQADIKGLDQQPRQVLLEMSIVEISSTALKMLGLNWATAKNLSGNSESRLQLNTVSDGNILSISQSIKGLSVPLIQALNFLTGEGYAEVHATPSIVTLDGELAEFSSLQSTWVEINSESSSRANEVSYGVTMKLIPRISDGNSVALNIIKASVSDLVTEQNSLPRLISHSVSNQVRINDGETLVLGGLLQKRRRQNSNRVPLLGGIPGLGWLFKYEEQQLEESEVVIVITPKILAEG